MSIMIDLPTLADLTDAQVDLVLNTDVEADEILVGRLEYADKCEALVRDDDTGRLLRYDPAVVRLIEPLPDES